MNEEYSEYGGSEMDIFEEYDAILAEYKRKEALRNLAGVGVSILVHVILVIVGFYVIVIDQPQSEASVQAEITEMEVKEIPEKKLKELEEIEQVMDQTVPTVAPPTPNAEPVETVEDMSTDVAAVDTVDISTNLSFKPMGSSLVLPGAIAARSGQMRKAVGNEFGINAATEQAILKALRWLKRHQEEGGYWMKKNNTEGDAMTGMALLAFLAHGDTPSSSREFGVTVQKAIDYLVRRVENHPNRAMGRAYTHGIVAYALSEAYAMTRLPEVGMAAENALGVIIRGQQQGGGYNYRYSQGNRWDMSVASWQFQAMKAASVAGIDATGLTEAMERGIAWVKNTTYRDGAFGYSSPGGNRLSMCGAGTTVLQLLGEHDCAEVRATLEQRLYKYEPKWEKINHNAAYSWYYMTQAIFHGGRNGFKAYFRPFSAMLVQQQADDGHWESPGEKGGKGRDVYMSTALNCLSLQVAYRYLPSYKDVTKTASRPVSEARTGQGPDDEDVFSFDDKDLGISVEFD